MSRISPIVLLVIVILAIGFFVLGLLQLLIRCLMKRPSFSSISQSNRIPADAAGSHTFQRQLQQLFRLHDSGLDQALIDALPVFYYREIIGLKEPFDCAVCLCEFSDGDKLKFLPNCTHAFHIHCIETWLLSNSTCPLCRSLIGSGNPMGNPPLFSFNDSLEQWSLSCPDGVDVSSSSRWPGGTTHPQENAGPARVVSVCLGKFTSSNEASESEGRMQNEVTSSSIDGRRCYSMGAFQYIVGDANLQVALSSGNGVATKARGRYAKEQFSNNMEADGKKIGTRTRGDSFSVSKIWLWSKKERFPSSLEVNESVALPMPNRCDLV